MSTMAEMAQEYRMAAVKIKLKIKQLKEEGAPPNEIQAYQVVLAQLRDTPRGKVIEEIEPRAFAEAINRAGNITVTVDHDKSHIYASTDDGTVTLKEDAIGLHADVLIKDKDLIELAKKGKIRGWSFGMYNVKDSMEERADDLPIRHIKALDLDHLTLVVKKSPIYSATSVELRAGEDIELETRASLDEPTLSGPALYTPAFDNSEFRGRIAALK